MAWISVPRTTFDLLLSPRATLNSPQSFVLCKGEISNYYRALQACSSWDFGGDVDCDGEVLNSNPKVFGIKSHNGKNPDLSQVRKVSSQSNNCWSPGLKYSENNG